MKTLIKILLLNTLIISTPISAAIVKINFQAEITNININKFVYTNNNFSQVGDIINGSFSYDTNAPLNGPTITNFYYQQPDTATFGVDMNVGTVGVLKENGNGYSVSMTINFQNSSLYNGAHSFSMSSSTLTDDWPGGLGAQFNLTLIDTTGTAFSSNALPNSLNLSDFDYKSFTINDWNSGTDEWSIQTNLTQLSVAAVPVPSSIVLFISGFLVLFRGFKSHITNKDRL